LDKSDSLDLIHHLLHKKTKTSATEHTTISILL